jgi:hypothetical protein
MSRRAGRASGWWRSWLLLAAVCLAIAWPGAVGGIVARMTATESSLSSFQTGSWTAIGAGTRRTSAWAWFDSTSGTEADVSSPYWAIDGIVVQSAGTVAASYGADYIELDWSDPLAGGVPVSSATLEVTLASNSGSSDICFYAETRRASDGSVLDTHGGPGNDRCGNGTTQTTITVPISSAVPGTGVANDLRSRLWLRSTSGARRVRIEQARVVVDTAYQTVRLYPTTVRDATGSSVRTTAWSLALADGTYHQGSGALPASFSPNRYLRAVVPATVPPGANVNRVEIELRFRSSNSARVCQYLEVLDGSTVVETVGSPGSPASCARNAFVDTSMVLSGSFTPAQVNGMGLRFLVAGAGTNRIRVDRVRASITWELP